MKRLSLIITLVLCAAIVSPAAAQQKGKGKGKAPPAIDLKGKNLKQTLADLLPGMGAEDMGARSGPQQQWQDICNLAGAPGNEALRKEASEAMAENLGPKVAAPARVWLLLQLQRIGKGECVDAVAAQLGDKDDNVRDSAARCLANNPAPDATGKLAAALPAAKGKARIGLINALGYRADNSALGALTKELNGPEPAAFLPAARALARIATPEAAQALAAARKNLREPAHQAISYEYLLCADRLLKGGKTQEAAAIFRELDKADEPRPVRLAALVGVLKTSGDAAGTRVLEIFAGNDRDARAVATSQIESLTAAGLKTVAGGIDKLPPASQVMVLTALAARGDRSNLAVALAAVKNKDEKVQQAGVAAVGKLGDAGAVPLLVDTLFNQAKLAEAARDSLTRLAGDGVNEKILSTLQGEKANDRRSKLIAVLESRRATGAVPVLLGDALSQDVGLRNSALSALKQVAEPKDIAGLIKVVLAAAKGKDREEAERTIVIVCEKIADADKRAEPVLGVLAKASKEERAALLPLLGRLGGAQALEPIKAALAEGKGDHFDAGLAGISNWPDRSVASYLLKLAQSAPEPKQRQQALRALVRVDSLDPDSPGADRLTDLKKAMELAASVEDKRLVLIGLGTVRDLETLRFVVPYLDNKDLAQEACRAVVDLAHSKKLREPNQAEFVRALDRVLTITQNADLIERAKKYKQGG